MKKMLYFVVVSALAVPFAANTAAGDAASYYKRIRAEEILNKKRALRSQINALQEELRNTPDPEARRRINFEIQGLQAQIDFYLIKGL